MTEPIIKYQKGTILYRYDENNKLLRVRVYECMDIEKEPVLYRCLPIEGFEDNSSIYLGYAEAHNKWIKLNEDAVISISVLKCEKKDVMVAVHPMIGPNPHSSIPFALCRQDVVDLFAMAKNPSNLFAYSGISISQKNCPPEMKIEDFMLCEEVLETVMISAYIEDDINDWLELIYENKYDSILRSLKKYRDKKSDRLVGYVDSLRKLLVSHNFMYDYHESLNITEVPFPINEKNSDLLKDVIGQMLQKVISNVYIIPYSKSIDTSEFEHPYMLMCPDWYKASDKDRKIFIVGYDIDESISYLAHKYGTEDKEEIINNLGFKSM